MNNSDLAELVPAVETPAEQTPPIAAVEEFEPFTPAQQRKLTQLIIKGKGEAARELRAKHRETCYELEQLKKSMLLPAESQAEVAAAKQQLAEARQELAKIDAQSKAQSKKAALLQATKEFIDPALAATYLASRVQYQGNALVVVDEDGEPQLNSSGEPLSIKELANQFGEKNKYLVRSTLQFGTGSVMNAHPDSTHGQPKLSELFGRDSNGAMANQLSLRNPAEYKRLRVRAVAAGLLAR